MNMRRMSRWIFAVAAMAAAARAQHYSIVPVPGAPHGIFTMMQDSHSALWLGTIDDVFRFDGEHFYSLRPYGFPRETPNSFAEDSDGAIWIATQGTDANGGPGRGGLYRYQAGRVEKIHDGDGLTVVALAPGIVIASAGTEVNGKPSYGDLLLFRKSQDHWAAATLQVKRADHLTLDHQGNLLFPCPGGWCEIAHQQLLDWRDASSPLAVQQHAGNPMIERVLRDRFGCVWMRAEAFGSYQCPADPQPKLLPSSVSQYDNGAHLEETSDGSVFMLVALALGRPGAFHIAIGYNGIPDDMDTAMVAKDGTIWIGAGSGLYRFNYPFRLEYWDKENGIASATSILRVGQDIFAADGGIVKLAPNRRQWTQFPGSFSLGGTLTAGPNGTLLAATRGYIAQLGPDGKILAQSPLPDDRSAGSFLVRTPPGEIWLGRNRMNRVIKQGNRFNVLEENLPEAVVVSMQYDDAHNTLWACHGNELLYRKNGAWGRITQQDGLLNLSCSAIGFETNGDVWVGYGAEAFSWIQNPASGHPIVRNFTQGLNTVAANQGVHFLSVDRRGRLWRGNEVLYLAASDAAKAGNWIRLDERDGLPPPIVSGNPFVSDPDGSVWFGTATGMAHFSPPEDFATTFPAPPVFIAGFTLAQGAATSADSIGPVPRNSIVVAHIGSLQFDRRGALHIRYRLLPGQTDWTYTDNLNPMLGKLGWGRHTLQVQAQLATGPWSPLSDHRLSVLWPFWFSLPFLLLLGTAGAGIGLGAVQWNKRQRFKREITLPDLSAWRMEALSPETERLIGTVIDGRYEIGHVLSVGGFATVARARDLGNDGQQCAIKIFRYELGDQAWVRHRFAQEVAALERLSHPNIVKITGHGWVSTGAPFLVMEFVHGESLRERLEQGALPRKQIAVFLRQIAGALQLLHRSMIYHRDLKPENLMIRTKDESDEQIVLIDFSIAIVKSPDQTFHGISRVAGTLDYMAPEQVIGYADAGTDIYSLAKIVIEMLTGLRWTELFPSATLDLPDQIRAYFVANSSVFKQDSVDLIVTALAFDPAHRPKDAVAFAEPIIRDLDRGS
jgi:sugar lactone lactonase YvrE